MRTTRKRCRNEEATIRFMIEAVARRGSGRGQMARSLVLHELNEDAAVDHDLVAGLETVGDVVLVAGAITQGHVLPREAAVGLGDDRRTAGSRRRARSPKPGPAGRCFPGGPESARGHTSASSGSRPDCRRPRAPPPNACRDPPGPRCCPPFRKSSCVAMPVTTSAGSPRLTDARSEPKTCAMTQTRDRSATVKHGVVPACRSSPGVISFSTTVPAIGERIMPSGRETGRPS